MHPPQRAATPSPRDEVIGIDFDTLLSSQGSDAHRLPCFSLSARGSYSNVLSQ